MGGIFSPISRMLGHISMKLNRITHYQSHMTPNNSFKIMSLKVKVPDNIFRKWTSLVEAH